MNAAWERFMTACRQVDGQPRPYTLRCTQAYRLEGGEWKIVLRHADELLRKDLLRR